MSNCVKKCSCVFFKTSWNHCQSVCPFPHTPSVSSSRGVDPHFSNILAGCLLCVALPSLASPHQSTQPCVLINPAVAAVCACVCNCECVFVCVHSAGHTQHPGGFFHLLVPSKVPEHRRCDCRACSRGGSGRSREREKSEHEAFAECPQPGVVTWILRVSTHCICTETCASTSYSCTGGKKSLAIVIWIRFWR